MKIVGLTGARCLGVLAAATLTLSLAANPVIGATGPDRMPAAPNRAADAGGAVGAAPDCPPLPVTVDDIVGLGGGALAERYGLAVTMILGPALDCYGSKTLTLTAFIAPPEGVGGTQAYSIEPRWLGDHRLFIFGTDERIPEGPIDGRFLTVAVPPSFGAVEERLRDRWVRLSGQFDHAAAQTCLATGAAGATPNPAETIEICRSMFVLTDISLVPAAPATDTEPEPDRDRGPSGTVLVGLILAALGGLVAASLAERNAYQRR
jgi:hypothetical protein